MKPFKLSTVRNSSVWGIYRLRDVIEMNPVYQREGEIWNLEKRQLLVDTIINQFDVPKIYLHKFPKPRNVNGQTFEYAVIDGKQRLSAIFSFIEGNYALSDSFEYIRAEGISAANFKYNDLAKQYPDLKTDFDSFPLDVIAIETDDVELIEDLFSRLNEAVPLNAAEKRNARPGRLPNAVRELAKHDFFIRKIPFANSRYRHFDLISKFLMSESRNGVVDTKKAYIDRFFGDHADTPQDIIDALKAKVSAVLDAMTVVFVDKDPLLRSVGMATLYFHLFRRSIEKQVHVSRPPLFAFEEDRIRNRTKAEADISSAEYNLLEFDRFTQSPNDAIAMRYRLAVIDQKLFKGKLGFEHESIAA